MSNLSFNHLAVRGWFRPEGVENCRGMFDGFQSPRGEGVVQTKKDMFNFASTDKVSITSR